MIVSGTFADSLDEQVNLIKQMSDLGANFVVCLVNQFSQENDSSDTRIKNAEYILENTGDIPLGLYECPAPYHRFLSAEEIAVSDERVPSPVDMTPWKNAKTVSIGIFTTTVVIYLLLTGATG